MEGFKIKELEKGSIILFVMLMVANICNYLFQIVMSRLLSVEDYGALNALISLLSIGVVPGITISVVVAKYVAEYNVAGEQFRIGLFLRKILFYVTLFAVITTAVGVATASLIGVYLKIEKVLHIILIMISIGLVFLLNIGIGATQGLKKFWSVGVLFVITPLTLLVLAPFFIIAGFKLDGVLSSYVIGYVISVLISFAMIKDKLDIKHTQIVAIGRRNVIKYAIPVFIITLCIIILTNLDMIMVKHYFKSYESGLYGPAVIFGKVLFYFPTAIVMAMFPLVVEANVLKEEAYGSLKKALLYTGILCGLGVLILNLFPKFITELFFGPKYLPAIPYIRFITIAMMLMCLLNIVVNFNLAMSNLRITVVSLVLGTIGEYLLMVRYHATVEQIQYALIGIGLTLLIVNIGIVILNKPGRELVVRDGC